MPKRKSFLIKFKIENSKTEKRRVRFESENFYGKSWHGKRSRKTDTLTESLTLLKTRTFEHIKKKHNCANQTKVHAPKNHTTDRTRCKL